MHIVGGRWGRGGAPRPLSCDEGKVGVWVTLGGLRTELLEALGRSKGWGRSRRAWGQIMKREGMRLRCLLLLRVSPLVAGKVRPPWVFAGHLLCARPHGGSQAQGPVT